MKKGLKIFFIIIALGLFTGLSRVFYMFNKPHRNIEKETPAFILDDSVLYNSFTSDNNTSNQKYVDKVIQVSGVISELSTNDYQVSVILDDAVSCDLSKLSIEKNKLLVDTLEIGDYITLKGKCDGYDDIMGVVLTQCFVISTTEN